MAIKTPWMDTYYVCVRKNVDLTAVTATHGNATATSATMNNEGRLITNASDDTVDGIGGMIFGNYKDIFGMGTTDKQKSEIISGSPTYPETRAYRLPLNNQPTFDPGIQVLTDRKFTGSPILQTARGNALSNNMILGQAEQGHPTDQGFFSLDEAEGGVETYKGMHAPVVSGIEFDIDRYNLVPWLWALFHTGASETAIDSRGTDALPLDDKDENSYLNFEIPRLYKTDAHTYAGANSAGDIVDGSFLKGARSGSGLSDPASTEAYIQFLHRQSVGNADSELITDAIVTSMTLSGVAGEAFKASVDLAGRKMVHNFDCSPASDYSDGELQRAIHDYTTEAPPMMWNDCEVYIRENGKVYASSGSGDTTIYAHKHWLSPLDNFSLTITPEVGIKYYNDQYPLRYTLNNWAISGSYTVPFSGVGQTQIDGPYFQNEFTAQNVAESTQLRSQELNLFWYGHHAKGLGTTDIPATRQQNCKKRSIGTGVFDTILDKYKNFAQEDGTTSGDRNGAETYPDAGDLGISLSTVITGVEISGDDESEVTVTFEGADNGPDGESTTGSKAIQIQMLNDVKYGIDDVTLTDNTLTMGNQTAYDGNGTW